MKTITGDLIALAKAGQFDVIIHGCNCQVKMGSGIAKQVRAELPEAWEADKKTDIGPHKIGLYSQAKIANGTTHGLVVVNAYTQVFPGKGSLSYTGLKHCFRNVRKEFGGRGLRFGYPLIGAGLAGGEWAVIAEIIDQEMEGEDHTLVTLPSFEDRNIQ